MAIVRAFIEGQDSIQGEKIAPGKWRLHAKGCHHFLKSLHELVSKNADPETWEVPKGTSHHELLLKEFILKVQNKWAYPYLHEEICHCRAVSTEIVDRAIMNGAFTGVRVSRETGASTSCGTCRPDVESIIKYRVG